MFDLFRSRAKAVRILLGVLLGMVALSMLVYLIPGAGTPTTDRNDQIVAEIGKDTVVTTRDVEMQVQQMMRGGQIPPSLVKELIPQQVEQMVAERAAAYQASQLGFEVTDRDLARTIRSLGQFASMNAQQYRDTIEQMGMSVPEFENNVRMQLQLQALQNMAMEGVVLTPAEVEAEYKRRNEKIKLEYIGFDPVKIASEDKPSQQDLQTYYERNKNFFSVPETRSVQFIVADQAKVAESIQIPDSQVQAYYNSHKDQYRTPERIHARHILLSTQGKPKDQVDKIKAKAEDLLKQLKSGADFAKLAEKNSEDPGSASKGGDLGWVVRGQMVKEFEDTTFSLKPKEISNLITTMYGFHIIQVLEKEPARLRTLDEVKPEILTSLRNQTVFDRMQTMADQAHNELVKAPQSAQQIAAKLNLEFVNIDKYRSREQIPQIGNDPQVAGTVVSLKQGEVSQVQQAGNKLYVAVVTNITPSHPGTFAELENDVRTRYSQSHSLQIVAEKAKKAADLLKSNGNDLKATAKAMGVEVKSTDFFERNGAAEGIGSASYLGDSFDKPVGTLIGPLNVGTQTVLAKIVERQQADMSKLPADRETIVSSLKSKKAGQRQVLFQDSVLNYLIAKGKVKMHRDVVNRLIARYGT